MFIKRRFARTCKANINEEVNHELSSVSHGGDIEEMVPLNTVNTTHTSHQSIPGKEDVPSSIGCTEMMSPKPTTLVVSNKMFS